MGSKGGGSTQSGFQASTSTYTPNPEAMAAYRKALGMASNVAEIPYEAYQGQRVAGLTEDQMAAMQGVREMQGMTQPYIDAATQASMAGLAYADPRRFSQEALQQYYNPYQQNVINATMANIDEMNRAQQNQLTGRIVSSGAMGGDRAGIARAELARQQNLVNQQTMAQLQAQGYGQAVNQYNQQQQQAIAAAQSGAYSLGQLGMQAQQAAMQGLQALLGTGGMQQQLGQQQLDAAFQAYQAARAYPYQQANFYAGIASGIAPNMGGTTNTMGFGQSNQQQPAPSGASQGLGLLTSALSFLPMLGGSDERTKANVEPWGEPDPETGLQAYAYDDVSDLARSEATGEPMPPKRVSVMAQDVEQAYPEAVTDIGGLKAIDQRLMRSDGGSAPSWGDQLSQAQYLNPNVPQGLEAVINPAMAHQMEQSKWVAHNDDQDINPYYDQSYTTPSQFIQQEPQMRADGGMVDWKKLPYGEPNPIEKPSFPFGTPRPQEPKAPDMGFLPGLPGGPKSGGAGGGGGGGSGGLGDLGKQISKLTKTMGKSHDAPHADTAHAPMAEPAAAAPVAEPAAPVAPAADLGAIQTPDILGGLGGLFGGMGFEHGGRVGYADGGSPAGGPSGGGLGDVSFGAPGAGYSGLLGRAMDWAKGAGEPPSPESMGLGSLQTEGPMYKPRTPLPSTWAVESQGKENPSMVPLMMMGAGGKFGNLGLLATIAGQQQAAGAAGERAQLGKTRESMLAQPRQPVGRFFDLYAPPGSNRPPRVGTSGLFPMMAKGNYYMPQYKDGGAVDMARGGTPRLSGPQIYSYLLKIGATPKEAIMLTAMAKAESEFNPSLMHDKNTGFGLWGHGKDRWADMQKYAGAYKPDWMSQAQFALHELRTSPKVSLARQALERSNSPVEIATAGMHYERPLGYRPEFPQGGHNWQGRLANVRQFAALNPNQMSVQSPSAEPIRTVSVRPVTGERAGIAAEPRPVAPVTPRLSVLKQINPADPSGPLLGQPAPDYTKISPRSNVIKMPKPTSEILPPAVPRKGFSLADLNPIGTAHADEMAPTLPSGVIPRVRPGFESIQGPGQLAGTQTIKQLQPGALTAPIGMPRTGIYDTDVTAFSPPGMGGDRDLYGAQPQGFGTFAPTDLSPAASQPWEQPPVAQDEPAKEAPASVREPAAKPIERAAPAPAEKGLFFGDYRDYEPWKSDPIGSAIDEMMGETPHSKHKGASMWDVGGGETAPASIGDLFRAHGGRASMAEGGDPLAYLDPEVFSSEPMVKPAGFDRAVVEPEPEVEEPIVATDRPTRAVPAARPAAQQRGLDLNPANWPPEVSQALLAAGLGMMAGTSPYAAVNIGQGGLAGLEVYQAARQQRQREEAAQAEKQAAVDKEKQRQDYLRRVLTTEPPKVSSVKTGSPTAALESEYDRLANALMEAPDNDAFQRISARMRAIETQIKRKQGSIGVIGTDEFGYPIRGWTSGEKAGQPLEDYGAAPSRGVKSQDIHGQDYLDTLEPMRAARIKAIAEGKEALPSGRGMERIRQEVTQYDPDYSEQRKKTRDAFSSTDQNKAGGQIIYGNTALGHLGELSDAGHALGNSGFKLWNWMKQQGRSITTGNPELEAFNATKDRFVEEATKFYRGTGGTEADIQRSIDRLSAAKTPQELDAVIAQEAKLFESKVKALEDQWGKVMGSSSIEAGDKDYDVIRGHAKEALEKIQSRAVGNDKGASSVEALAKKYGMTPEQLRAKYEQMKQRRQ